MMAAFTGGSVQPECVDVSLSLSLSRKETMRPTLLPGCEPALDHYMFCPSNQHARRPCGSFVQVLDVIS
jgi:hypothetical protein